MRATVGVRKSAIVTSIPTTRKAKGLSQGRLSAGSPTTAAGTSATGSGSSAKQATASGTMTISQGSRRPHRERVRSLSRPVSGSRKKPNRLSRVKTKRTTTAGSPKVPRKNWGTYRL